jgi:hypothetical protein
MKPFNGLIFLLSSAYQKKVPLLNPFDFLKWIAQQPYHSCRSEWAAIYAISNLTPALKSIDESVGCHKW